jgi:AAA15 family ATPase/GTPase
MEKAMLVEFRVGNYRSFREEQTLSLVAGNDTELTDNCVDQGKLRLLKAAGIYGPNASGKSNLIRALSTMRRIIIKPSKPGEQLPVTPFKLDDEYINKPSSFEVTFYHGASRYQYGFTATSERIHDEWLYAYPMGRLQDRAQAWFKRTFDEKADKTNWKFSTYLKGEKEKLKDRATNNVLFLTAGAQWNNKQLTTVYEWFVDKLRIIKNSYELAPITAEMLYSPDDPEQETMRSSVTRLMQSADFGICDISVEKSERDMTKTKFPTDMPNEIKQKFLQQLKYKLLVKMGHRNTKTGKKVFLSLEEESKGTQCYFKLLGPWSQAISKGITVFIDEIEESLHPLLVRELIKVIQNLRTNENKAQLIFATHDTTLLDHELFRRDQIWFTEKDKNGVTQLYSMSDYKERKARKGEAMQKGYLAGRYGAIPIIEAFELNG